MYKKQKDIRANHYVITVLVLCVIILGVLLAYRPVQRADKVQTIVQQEIYRNYTVERYDGVVTTLYLDLKVYNYTDCDYMTKNEEGHNCVIADKVKIWEELTILGYN